MGKDKTRRRQLIVHGPVQARIMLNAALLPFTILAMNTILVASFCKSLSQEAVAAGVELPSAMYLLVASATFLLASSGFIAIYVLLLSHRIAGPMFGISKALKAVQAGDLDRRCLLRKHDLLWPLSDDVNKFLEWLQEEHGEVLTGGKSESKTARDRSAERDESELSSAERAETHA